MSQEKIDTPVGIDSIDGIGSTDNLTDWLEEPDAVESKPVTSEAFIQRMVNHRNAQKDDSVIDSFDGSEPLMEPADSNTQAALAASLGILAPKKPSKEGDVLAPRACCVS